MSKNPIFQERKKRANQMSKYLIFQEVKKKRAERDTTDKKISKNPIFQERQKKRDTTDIFCTFGKFFFFTSWNIKYFACVTLQTFFGHFFGENSWFFVNGPKNFFSM